MKDPLLLAGIGFLLVFSLLILRSIAPFLFPYYFIFIFLGLIAILFSRKLILIYGYFSVGIYLSSP